MMTLEDWLDEVNGAARLALKRVKLADSDGWRLDDGVLRSETGRYFSVRGLQAAPHGGEPVFTGPMIDQREVGRLGFLVRPDGRRVEWLLQAKTEPGSHAPTQIAPSIQATPSNFQQVHHGEPTQFLELFRRPVASLSHGPFSEQGSRFLWKFNRNQVVALPAGASPEPEGDRRWRWAGAAQVRAMLGLSHRVNTDARSVIATAPWALLCDSRLLFGARVLTRSYSGAVERRFAARKGMLKNRRVDWSLVGLDRLPGWTLNEYGLADPEGRESVVCYRVRVQGREVGAWAQPFLTDPGLVRHGLAVRVRRGALQVHVRPYGEPGFGGRVELGPSVQAPYAAPKGADAVVGEAAQVLCDIEQSDEGGRFFDARAAYTVALVDDAVDLDGGAWLTLGELERVARTPGLCTNELRTFVSMILSTQFDEACRAL